MTRTKRKTTKRKSRKHNKKKKRLNAGVFFTIIVLALLSVMIYYFYQHEQQKRKEIIKSQNTEIPVTSKPSDHKTVKEKVTNEKINKPSTSKRNPETVRNNPQSKGKPQSKKQKQPSIARIIDYTDLEYPVSYSSQPEQIIFHTGHTVSYNKDWKIPNWVSYELTIDETIGDEKRNDKFCPDPNIREGTATLADYRNSGYDRGHMAPAADLKWNSATMQESFYLSNICPQHPQLNQRRWKDLENKVREWAIADSAVIVICGPIVNKSPKRIGSNKVVVPHGFFKIILSPFIDSPKAIGFIFDNVHCTGTLHSHIVSIDSVESATGLDFFAPLPDEIEVPLEAFVDTLYWGL